ncbi:MAG: acylphosphatase [Candidatus Aerophobus sp.]|nr:MAG: acylphosphatase [Candidatus Aerophobus sp.]
MEVKKVRAHVLIKGRVQGVFFRAETRSQAYSLGLTGWVRNRWGGSVEAVFEGEDQKVRKMIAWCYKGPPSAVVEDVEVEWEDYKGEFASFSVRY